MNEHFSCSVNKYNMMNSMCQQWDYLFGITLFLEFYKMSLDDGTTSNHNSSSDIDDTNDQSIIFNKMHYLWLEFVCKPLVTSWNNVKKSDIDLLTTLSESNPVIQLFTQLIVLKLNEEEIDWLKMMILFSSTSDSFQFIQNYVIKYYQTILNGCLLRQEQLMHLIQTIYSCINIKCNLPMNWLKYYIECIFQLNNEQFNLIIKQMIFTAIETSEMLMMTTPSTQLPPPPPPPPTATTTTTAATIATTTTSLH
ncbi:unnamed protein product [Schistosoma mattheei]|uniref:Uncharacterized protein n=1 Tax=Schistosoma mattheei TaxID=31246 RepID=A0AA85C448_9TREM|nr:unnamed protein product [Schistosoma mattheei]